MILELAMVPRPDPVEMWVVVSKAEKRAGPRPETEAQVVSRTFWSLILHVFMQNMQNLS